MIYAQTSQFDELNEEAIVEILKTDDQSQIVNQMSDSEIISSVLNTEESNSETESDVEEIPKVFIAKAISVGDSYLKFLETQDCVTEQEIFIFHRIQKKLFKKKTSAKTN